jgi:hypothetical protein
MASVAAVTEVEVIEADVVGAAFGREAAVD